ncbi:Na(+)/H(+) antiporter NhaA [Planctomycetes bacterium CA13]|uniref:Na(+)/H(+) antiporter NhaA n=1 Tax=Novipirellula herctigrandis TaxID=2527986 RepID=A0A5C5YXT8_9BACT|nr:Na(+)/H(+) antiporter NhaA [Planctomycetes bacterium CA13]
MSGATQNRGVLRTLIDNSFLLIAGAVGALVWANIDQHSYEQLIHFDLLSLFGGGHEVAHEATGEGAEHAASHGLTLHFIVNDILMALFFAIAAKEVWESLLPGGALSNPRKAATPLLATVGGIAGPALVYIAGAYMTGTQVDLGKGWAIPCATDIAFSYLIARFIFGASHPAIAFLLLLAIADDAAGLMILAVFYPQAPIAPQWLLLTLGAMLGALVLRRMKVHTHWAYLIGPGIACWYSFFQANIHPALGLVPIIPLLPHAHTDLGIFAREELNRGDTLSEFEHFWKLPVEVVLGLFGLANAGVVMSSLGTGTWIVLAGLLIGKPVGITALTWFAEKVLKLEKPAGMDYRHVVTLGMVAGIGFTVALFVSVAAFTVPGAIQDSVKMGALLSFGAAPLSFLIAKVLGVRPQKMVDVDVPAEAQPA